MAAYDTLPVMTCLQQAFSTGIQSNNLKIRYYKLQFLNIDNRVGYIALITFLDKSLPIYLLLATETFNTIIDKIL